MTNDNQNLKILVVVLTYNEGERLENLINQFPSKREYEILFVDDGSTDNTTKFLSNLGFTVIKHQENLGVGAGIHTAVKYCRENGFDTVVIMAGNGKMLPEEIPRLIEPIKLDQADYIQGSRYLQGGESPNLPRFRNLAIKLFTFFINILLGFKGTDITCGFRAYRISILDDPNINIDQEWLGRYEMEYYLHYKAIKNGYRVIEVPVSMVYPENQKDYSKIKPFIGWWSMIRPWVFLTLGIKK